MAGQADEPKQARPGMAIAGLLLLSLAVDLYAAGLGYWTTIPPSMGHLLPRRR